MVKERIPLKNKNPYRRLRVMHNAILKFDMREKQQNIHRFSLSPALFHCLLPSPALLHLFKPVLVKFTATVLCSKKKKILPDSYTEPLQ